MHAAMTPNKISHVRQYQLGILNPFCCISGSVTSKAFRDLMSTARIVCHVLIVEHRPD